MASSSMGSVRTGLVQVGSQPAEAQQSKTVPSNCGPMMQQSAAHGYEMHPQEFVRLIGCHESVRQKEGAEQEVRL